MLTYLGGGGRAVGWIAWYRGRPVSAHADLRVLAALMAAEGLGGAVRYTRAEDGVPDGRTDSDGASAGAADATPPGAAAAVG